MMSNKEYNAIMLTLMCEIAIIILFVSYLIMPISVYTLFLTNWFLVVFLGLILFYLLILEKWDCHENSYFNKMEKNIIYKINRRKKYE